MEVAKIYAEVGARIREAREACRLSQDELGAMLTEKRTGATVSIWEKGGTRIPLDAIVEMVGILGKPLSFFLPFLGGEELAEFRMLGTTEREVISAFLRSHRANFPVAANGVGRTPDVTGLARDVREYTYSANYVAVA
ncbi:MAG: helix-turn-helix transcriptional regulator [Patescibacteria group bacterium]|nr:helix-turn-helix transcriptional regulator [Patescibacteria group bacterium]